jgi:hypothetical protein
MARNILFRIGHNMTINSTEDVVNENEVILKNERGVTKLLSVKI